MRFIRKPVFFDPHSKMQVVKAPEAGELKFLKELPDRKIKLVALAPHFDKGEKLRARKRSLAARTPSISQLMKHCDSSKYFKGAISRAHQGFVIDTLNLPGRISEYIRFKSNLMHNPKSAVRANLERVRIIQQLAELGFKVVVPRYVDLGKIEPKSMYPKIRNFARIFKVRRMLRYDFAYIDDKYYGKHPLDKTQVPANNYWARDIYKKIDNKRISFTPNSTNVFGEGGLSVDIGSNAFFASPRLKEDRHVQELIRKGNKVYFLKNRGNRYVPELSRAFKTKIYVKASHIDLFLGVVGKNIVVDPFFLKENQEVIQEAAREHQLKIIQIPSSEIIFQPANFLVLGPNEILIERRAVKTRRVLERAGVKVHPTIVSLKSNLEQGGGVRCIVNEV